MTTSVPMPPPDSPPTVRFGEFALDVAAYQLRHDGRPVKLGRQPMDLLILLVERHGQLVTRADIVSRLWGPDVFVDVEMGVNTAISKVRHALRDAPEAPRFLETVSGKGYRFIAPIEGVPPVSPTVPPAVAPAPAAMTDRPRPPARRRPAIAVAALVAVLAVIAAGVFAVRRARSTQRPTAVRWRSCPSSISTTIRAQLSGDWTHRRDHRLPRAHRTRSISA